MGGDMMWARRDAEKRDAAAYRDLRSKLADLVGLAVIHDVRGPGDHQGATDAGLIKALRARLGT